ncbi:MAG: thioredoxin-disulfide reductase [Chloroflexi bacterium]|nr:thioredoxin-disulfide reductase [Chloroflexota bacterium]
MEDYDVVIIGGGPAGLTAGLYAARAKMKAVLLERKWPGGQLLNTDKIEDYPGFDTISGPELAERMEKQARKLGLQIAMEEAVSIRPHGNRKLVKASGEKEYLAKAVVVTAGGEPRRLGVPGEAELAGRGVSYCAICDGAFFQDQVVAVVGGGDAAVEEGAFLTRFASKVYIVHRRPELRASRDIQEKARQNPKIEFVLNAVVEEIHGTDQVEYLTVLRNGQRERLEVNGVFVFVGFVPNTELFHEPVERDPQGHLVTNAHMETSLKGIFAAGDVRSQLTRQITTAVGDGTTAVVAVQHYIESLADEEAKSRDAQLVG